MALFISLSAGNAEAGPGREAGSDGPGGRAAQPEPASCCLWVLHQGQPQRGLQTQQAPSLGEISAPEGRRQPSSSG